MDCTLFGARADGLSKILTKGAKVAIDGKLRWSQWEREGQKRSKVEIIVDSLDFMSQRNAGVAPLTTAPVTAAVAPATPSEPADQSVAPVAAEPVAPVAAAPVDVAPAEAAPSAPAPEAAGEPYGEDIPF